MKLFAVALYLTYVAAVFTLIGAIFGGIAAVAFKFFQFFTGFPA